MRSLYWESFQDGMVTAARRIQAGETAEQVLATAAKIEYGEKSAVDREYLAEYEREKNIIPTEGTVAAAEDTCDDDRGTHW